MLIINARLVNEGKIIERDLHIKNARIETFVDGLTPKPGAGSF